jgi:hypothetical protein
MSIALPAKHQFDWGLGWRNTFEDALRQDSNLRPNRYERNRYRFAQTPRSGCFCSSLFEQFGMGAGSHKIYQVSRQLIDQ